MISPTRWARATAARGADRVALRVAERLQPRLQASRDRAEQIAREQSDRLEGLEVRGDSGLDQALRIQQQLFYAGVAELVRRHAGATALPPGPDLTRFELHVYSQNGEDGVIAEMLRRIGPGKREFVEFGAEYGLEGNCVALSDILGWRGLFIEGDETKAQSLARKYRGTDRVHTMRALVTAENIDELLAAGGVSDEPDIVSIDIDGDDLWVWRAMTRARPRLVVIEYNAHLDHDRPLAVPYDPGRAWEGTDWFGASLAALRVVAGEKGYRLAQPTSLGPTPSSSATTWRTCSTTSRRCRGARRTTSGAGSDIPRTPVKRPSTSRSRRFANRSCRSALRS